MIVMIVAACSGDLFFAHFGAVFVVGMAVGGVHGFFEADAAFAGEAESVGTAGDDFIAGEEAFGDLDELIVLSAEHDAGFDEGVFEVVVLDVDEAVGGVALNGGAGDGHDVFAGADDNAELGLHARAEEGVGIGDVEGGFDGVGVGIGDGGDVGEFGFEDLVGQGGQADVGDLALLELAGEVLGDVGGGFDGAEVDDFNEGLVGRDGLTGNDVDLGDDAADGSFEHDGGRWIAGLAAFDPGDFVSLFDLLVRDGEDGEGAAGDAAADDGAFAGEDLDGAQGEDGFLEGGFFGLAELELEIGDFGLFEDEGVRLFVRFEGEQGDRLESEQGHEVFERHEQGDQGFLSEVDGAPRAVSWRMRAR